MIENSSHRSRSQCHEGRGPPLAFGIVSCPLSYRNHNSAHVNILLSSGGSMLGAIVKGLISQTGTGPRNPGIQGVRSIDVAKEVTSLASQVQQALLGLWRLGIQSKKSSGRDDLSRSFDALVPRSESVIVSHSTNSLYIHIAVRWLGYSCFLLRTAANLYGTNPEY